MPTGTSGARSFPGRRPTAPTTSAPRSPEVLAGPVAVCVDRPILSLDRAFTYELPAELGAGVGSLVQVPFHGRAVRGWVLGPTEDLPARMLAVKKAVSPERVFDEELLDLARWVSERYVAPLAAVLGRLAPPRVAAEEGLDRGAPGAVVGPPPTPAVLASYRGGPELLAGAGRGRFAPAVLRPAPEHEVAATVELVGATLAAGRRAIVVVPEATPVPATAAAIVEAFGDRAALYLGGSKRARYRTWLDIAAGRFDVVVGTRPSVFARVPDLGAIVVSRESHPAHREDRAPYYHVRDVALARARLTGLAVVLSAICPSSEAAVLEVPEVTPPGRRWVPVEVVKPGPEGRAHRLVQGLRSARRAFIYSPLPGYGIAAVCRTCGEPAACAACGGLLRSEEGQIRCVVCEAPGRCRNCAGTTFGVRRGGQERVEEWAAGVATASVARLGPDDVPRLPADGEVLVGGPDDIRDLGPGGLDLVAVLDADLAGRRPGLAARERAVTTWMEAIAWARPVGRAIVQSSHANDPAVQALVQGNPRRFHGDEARRRAEAGFPVGTAVFRVAGATGFEAELDRFEPSALLVSALGEQTVCLLALDPRRVPEFGRAIRELAARDLVTRVEAEPHL
ncbi:MAG: primosomal protein N' family DNA-binding protein [Actinomycetota bacterium]